MLRRASASLALVAAVGVVVSCVIWPAGTGPGAEPMSMAEAVDRRDRGEAVIVDLRSRGDFAQGHIPGAISVPLDELAQRVGELRALQRLPILYCG